VVKGGTQDAPPGVRPTAHRHPICRDKRLAIAAAVLLVSGSALRSGALAATPQADWPTYGHDLGGMRFSPLDRVNTSNVTQLQVAWTYHMRPVSDESRAPEASNAGEQTQRAADGAGPLRRRRGRFSQSEATPLVVDGLMYVSTPYRRVVALEPETGKEVWAYQLPGSSQPTQRGLAYWSGDSEHAPRIVFGTRDGWLIALDAKTGRPPDDFGNHGLVDLKTPEVMPAQLVTTPFGPGGIGMTSPPLVYRNLVITGSIVQEYPQHGPYGDVRAWDVRTGKLTWTFHSVPRPGEYGHDTWKGDSWRQRSGTNAWGLMTADERRGIVYMPFGAPTWDRYGGDRLGANLYGTSIVAADANTGKRLWHFQIVHHDIWDMDAEAPPLLLDVKQGRRVIPAVAIVSKSGLFFLLNRVNGKPIFDIEERKVPASDVPGEQAWPTQPFPVKPAPFARQSFAMADVATVTPELEAYCRSFIDSNHVRIGGPYLPLGYKTPTINFPGRQGGANWGGGAFDPTQGLFFINANNLGQVEQLQPRDDGSLTISDPTSGRFSDRDRKLMCQQPPWGTLTAIKVETGEIAWQSVLGVSDQLPAAQARTGRPSVGGPIATAGGLVFIGGTDDSRFRAFSARTGEELWTVKVPASAHATPITYEGREGKQYVAIVSTGGSFLDSPVDSDALTVFALP
jgi:quinoprotein glucose dehydrogenase